MLPVELRKIFLGLMSLGEEGVPVDDSGVMQILNGEKYLQHPPGNYFLWYFFLHFGLPL